jgi:hypothetical protein
MTIPSQRKFVEAFGPEVGLAAYRLAKGLDDPRQHPAVVAWAEKCYHDPCENSQAYGECLLTALNTVLGGYGDEPIRGRHVDGYYQDIQASYVNMGDTYTTTVLLDHETNRLVITSWGDWYERHERNRQLV